MPDKSSPNRCRKVVTHKNRGFHRGFPFSKGCIHYGVGDANGICGGEVDIVPNAHLAPRYGGYPVPADGGMEGGVVATKHTTVETGVFCCFGLSCTRIGILLYIDTEFVIAIFDIVGNIKLSAHEGTLYLANLLAVEYHQGLPVDTVEVEQDASALHL